MHRSKGGHFSAGPGIPHSVFFSLLQPHNTVGEVLSPYELIERATRRKSGQGISLHYMDARRGRGLPQAIKPVRPSDEGCRRLQKLYADTLDSRIVLACLPPGQRTEAFLGLLTAATLSRLQSASLELVFGEEWRSKLATLAVGGDRARTAD